MGRSEECEVLLYNEEIELKHATIVYDEKLK